MTCNWSRALLQSLRLRRSGAGRLPFPRAGRLPIAVKISVKVYRVRVEAFRVTRGPRRYVRNSEAPDGTESEVYPVGVRVRYDRNRQVFRNTFRVCAQVIHEVIRQKYAVPLVATVHTADKREACRFRTVRIRVNRATFYR